MSAFIRRPVVAGIFLALAATIGAGGAISGPLPVAGHGGMGNEPLAPDVRGTYQMPGGDLLTFTGPQGMPSYELAGRRVYMRPVSTDRFAAWDDATDELLVEREAGGAATGIVLLRDGRPVARGTKVTLYSERDVSFASGSVTIAGSLLLPTGPGPHPAVVLVHGAEAASRETYRLMASHFARRGVAALIYDKRGVGESGGSFRQATFDDLVADALAGLQLLRSTPGVDKARVGLLGISQGGWIIAMAGAASDDVAFLIPISASGFSPAIQDRWLNGNIIAHRHLNRALNGTSERAWRMLLSTRQLVDAGLLPAMPDVPGFWFHALDPGLDAGRLWGAVRQPLLGVWGELDCQVPAYDSLARVQAALEGGQRPSYTLTVLRGADHSMSLVAPCAQETSGWSVLRFDYPPDYFAMLADWVHAHDTPAPVARVVLPEQPTPSSLGWHQAPTDGAGIVGSFVPQMLVLLGLLGAFALLSAASLVRTLVAAARRRSVRPTALGVAAGLGLLAMLLGVASLVELLLLGSPDGGLLVGGPIAGLTPTFALASAATLGTLVSGAAGLRGALAAGGPRVAISALTLILFAAWAAHWSFVPLWVAFG